MHLDLGSGLHCAPVYSVKGFTESSVYDDAISLWLLNEASGTRADSIGSNDLTDNNTVGYVNLGPQGTVASFVTANTESLSVDPGPTPTVVSISAWVNCSSSSAGDQYGQVFSLKDGLLFLATGKQDSGNLFFAVEEYSSAWYGTMTAKGWTASSTYNTWNHLLAEISDDAHTITLYLNGALWVGPIAYSNSWGTGVAATKGVIGPKGMVYTGSVIGPSTAGFNPKIARTGVWSRVLTAEERTSLYNSGLGKSYSDLTTAEKVGLVSYWNLDEASGNRADSHGSNDLTDNNTVTSVNSGPSGVVANFVRANSESLSHSGDPFKGNTAFSVAFWANVPSTGGTSYGLVGRDGANRDWSIISNGVGAQFYHLSGGFPNTTQALTESSWNFIVAYLTPSGEMGISVNNATPTTTTADAGHDVSSIFSIGSTPGSGALDCKVSRVGFWNRILTAGERTSLFNAGVGKRFADLTTAEKVSLVSWWDLTETSGTRVDSLAANSLTDNNTVTSLVNYPANLPGRVASFVAGNSEYLSAPDDGAGLSIDGDHSFSVWFYSTGTGTNRAIISQRTAGDGAYQLYLDTSDQLHAYVTDSVSGFSEPVRAGAIADNGWHLAIMTYTASDKKLRLYLDDGSETAGSALSNGPVSSTQDFNVVRLASVIYGSIRLSSLGAWSRVLTPEERAALFNSGNGAPLP